MNFERLSLALSVLTFWIIIVFLGMAVLSCLQGKKVRQSGVRQDIYCVLSLGLVLPLLSFVYVILISIYSGASPFFYRVVITILAIGLLLAGSWRRTIFYLPSLISRGGWLYSIASLLVLFFILTSAWSMLTTVSIIPIYANDPLEYATVARVVTETRDASVYPIMDNTLADGFYGGWTHGIGFVATQSLLLLMFGEEFGALFAKSIGLYYFLLTILLIIVVFPVKYRLFGAASGMLYLFSPLLVDLAVINHIDHIRIFAFLAPFIALSLFIKQKSLLDLFFIGVFTGLSPYLHSIGVLCIPILIGLVAFNQHCTFRDKYNIFSAMAAGLVVFWGSTVYRNIKLFGNVIEDSAEVWSLPGIRYDEYIRTVRGLEHDVDILLNGVLKPLYNYQQFGLLFFVLLTLLGIKAYTVAIRNVTSGIRLERILKIIFCPRSIAHTIGLALIGFYAIYLLSIALDLTTFSKNNRYLLTIQPLAAIVTGFLGIWFVNTANLLPWASRRT